MYQDFSDKAFADAMRYLKPEIDQRNSRFEQTMVNKGLAPGSEAYRQEFDNFSRAENDALSGAAFDALQFGASRMDADRNFGETQRQFDTSLGENKRQFNTGLREDTRRFDKGFGEDARRFDMGFGEDARRFDTSFGEGQRQFDEGTRRFDMGFDEDARRFDSNFAEDTYRDRRDFGEDRRRFDRSFDLGELTTMNDINFGYMDRSLQEAAFNASRDDQAFDRLAAVLSGASASGPQQLGFGSTYGSMAGAQSAGAGQSMDFFGNLVGAGTGIGSLFI